MIFHKQPDGSTLRLYTLSELAGFLSRTRKTLERWEQDGILPVRYRIKRGKQFWRVFTEEEVEALRLAYDEWIHEEPEGFRRRSLSRLKLYIYDHLRKRGLLKEN